MVGPKCGTCGNFIKTESDLARKVGKNYTMIYCKKCGVMIDLITHVNLKEQ
ncbi:TPA: hypothetical protein H1012_01620 [archaeon]|nr:hypothetical protein [Candidatus Naiadarchaeales archaeon SRR2090159.bin1288]